MSKNIFNTFQEKTQYLSDLHDREARGEYGSMGVARLRGLMTRTVQYLTTYQPAINVIQESLDTQRIQQHSMGLKRFSHDTDHYRERTMQQQGSSPFYYFQRAFSLPEDYVQFPQGGNWQKMVHGLVFQVEYIPDTLLEVMELFSGHDMSRDTKKSSLQERAEAFEKNITKKIELLSVIKNTLSQSTPLVLGEGKQTGRILRLPNGAYMVFQDQSQGNVETPDRPLTRYGVLAYRDIYSLMRSQTYGADLLSHNHITRADMLGRLETLKIHWRMLSGEQKQQEIQSILTLLEQSNLPKVVRARDRLMHIQYSHNERDVNRILWATNDLRALANTHKSKESTLIRQAGSLYTLLRSEEIQFQSIRTIFLEAVQSLPEKILMDHIHNGTELDNELQKRIQNIFATLQSYAHTTHWVGKPFSWFRDWLLARLDHYQWSTVNILRLLFHVVLAIKKQSYIIALSRWHHALKQSPSYLPDIGIEMYQLRELLEQKTFLPDFDLTSTGQERFQSKIQFLDSLQDACTKGAKTTEVLRIIQDELQKFY